MKITEFFPNFCRNAYKKILSLGIRIQIRDSDLGNGFTYFGKIHFQKNESGSATFSQLFPLHMAVCVCRDQQQRTDVCRDSTVS